MAKQKKHPRYTTSDTGSVRYTWNGRHFASPENAMKAAKKAGYNDPEKVAIWKEVARANLWEREGRAYVKE